MTDSELASVNDVSLEISVMVKPFGVKEPDIERLPVMPWTSSPVSPNWVEPLLNMVVDWLKSDKNSSAVIWPATVIFCWAIKLFDITKFAVIDVLPLIELSVNLSVESFISSREDVTTLKMTFWFQNH